MNDFYNSSDYKQNQFTPDIVFPSVVPGKTVCITQDAFLAENPQLTPEDFAHWKRWMLGSLLDLLNHDRREGAKHLPLRDDLVSRYVDFVAEDWVELVEAQLEMQQVIKTQLTAHEARRVIAYWFSNCSVEEIAKAENATKGAVSQSISNGMKKLKKYYGTA